MSKDLIKCWLLMPFLVIVVSGDCTLDIKGDSAVFSKNIGSLHFRIKAYNNHLEMIDDERISVYCSNYIEFSTAYRQYVSQSDNVKSLKLLCSSNEIQYARPQDSYYSKTSHSRGLIKCSNGNQQILYETSNILPNCMPFMTYSIAKSFSDTEQMLIARICYNFNVLRLKYVHHLAYYNNYEFLFDNTDAVIENITSNDVIRNWQSYFSFMSSEDFKLLYSSKQLDLPILNSIDFTYASIIQDIPLQNELKNYENLLSIIWWNNLKYGNWKLYLSTLRNRTNSNKYDVYTGTFDEIKVPTFKWTNNETLNINFKGKMHAAPKYIWSYIKSVSSNAINEEFVVIGYNSPFYDNLEDIIFCEDVCDEIDWMKMSIFNKVRRMMTMGLVFCCRPEDVVKTYPDFPILEKQQSTTSTIIETTAPDDESYTSNNINDDENILFD